MHKKQKDIVSFRKCELAALELPYFWQRQKL